MGFDEGVIVEQGTHEQLMDQQGIYYTLVTNQVSIHTGRVRSGRVQKGIYYTLVTNQVSIHTGQVRSGTTGNLLHTGRVGLDQVGYRRESTTHL